MLKGLFGGTRQGKRDDAELGKGVWRRVHDRFRRGLDRFHQMLEGIEEDAVGPASTQKLSDNYAAIVPVANGLAGLLPQVRRIAVQAQTLAPSEGMEIPAGKGGQLNDVHRELSRAGNALAAAAEAVAMVRLGAGDVSAVERRALIVHEHLDRAAALLDGSKTTDG